MNLKKLLALVLALVMVICALPAVYATVSEDAGFDDSDISIGVEELQPDSVIYGDADGDGEVSTADAARILQYRAGWDVTLGG